MTSGGAPSSTRTLVSSREPSSFASRRGSEHQLLVGGTISRSRSGYSRAVSEALSWIRLNWSSAQLAMLSIREGNVASEAVASRLGFKSDPCRDERIEVRGECWNMQAWSRTLSVAQG